VKTIFSFSHPYFQAAFILTTAFVLSGAGAAEEDEAEAGSQSAWKSWKEGRIEAAHLSVREVLKNNPSLSNAQHIFILTSFAMGKFEDCMDAYEVLDRGYSRYDEVTSVIIEALNHLNRSEEAAELAKEVGLPENQRQWLEKRWQKPLKVVLNRTTILRFSEENMLGNLMPAVPIEINGIPLMGHLDTGGAFINTSPKVAERCGIEVEEFGSGIANMQNVTILRGLAENIKIGKAVLTNVPVGVLRFPENAPKPPGLDKMVIIGTNILEQFLTTWDNCEGRLILSPRGDGSARAEHMKLLPESRTEMGFFFLGSHHLGAMGGVGEHKDLLLHVDTGLVIMDAEGRQPALAMTSSNIKKYDIPYQGGPFADDLVTVSLGSLEDSGHLIHASRMKTPFSWEGLNTAATLSHGFTKKYIWTMDFDNYKWLFSKSK
jgi:hypothetical protein